jgi:hypothetical protein
VLLLDPDVKNDLPVVVFVQAEVAAEIVEGHLASML